MSKSIHHNLSCVIPQLRFLTVLEAMRAMGLVKEDP